MASRPGSRARRVLANSAVLAISKVLERTSGFVVGVLVANALGANGLGVYAAAWAIYGLIAVAGTAGTTDFLVREISRDRSRTADYAVHLSLIAFGFATVVMLAAEVVVRQVGYSAGLEHGVSVMLLAIVPKVLNGIQEGVFVAHGRVAFQTLTRFWSSMAYVALAAWMLARGAEVVALLTAFVALEYGVAVVYFIIINRAIARLRSRLRWSLARRLMREMKAFTGSSLIAALFARPEVVLLSVMSAERQIGLYSAALRIVEIPLTLSEVLMVNVFPMLSESFRTAEERFRFWQTASVRALVAFSLLFAAVCLALADDIVRILYGADLAAAASILRVAALNVAFFSLISVFWRSLVARERQGTNLALQAFTVGARLGTGAALIAPFGALGAAISSTASSALHLGLLVRATDRSGAPTRVLRVSWRFALAAAGSGTVMWLLARWLPWVAALLAGAALYVPLLLALRAVTPADRLLWRRVRSARASA
ncbi:MAG TPA: oligosaccharide flippase family protein [Baekduia sp.]|nr:oligosaccharide flippase family protein [Baekduia sp.]